MTGVSCPEGALVSGEAMAVSAESDQLVAFGDGIESDSVAPSWGQRVSVGLAGRTLRLVR